MENEKESVKVLIVDDEQDIRTLLNIYLKRLGYDVVEAADGVEAVETVRADKDIDLIVMDIMMPKLSGTEACPHCSLVRFFGHRTSSKTKI